MEIWYRAGDCLQIDRVEVERSTDWSVYIGGRQHKRQTSYHRYFRTWDEARNHLIDACRGTVQTAEAKLRRAENDLRSAIALSPPLRIELGINVRPGVETVQRKP
jgi:hypothetical protein